jgi:GH15 family glucan-1,4-alpha-glucosidase
MTASLKATADYIENLQLPSGALPWFKGGITDPWDHTEVIMGLNVAGRYEAARKGLEWLTDRQNPNGGWFAAYNDKEVADGSRIETNFVAYMATGLWHYYESTKDIATLRKHWPTAKAAIEFVLTLQQPTGEIYWAIDTKTGPCEDALITGCSSIYKSLNCAIKMATVLGHDCDLWIENKKKLRDALVNKPERFDRTWESKSRYSMDWFYPIMTGVINGNAAKTRLERKWHIFVEPGLGCRCVADQPWVTVAETCELIVACIAVGEIEKAKELFANIQQFQLEDGSWWTGYVFTESVHWPNEMPTWTSAAVLLAADALSGISKAAGFFSESQ